MGNILKKSQQDQAKEIYLTLSSAIEGLPPGSPKREAAYKKALEGLVDSISKEEELQPVWDFTSEKNQSFLTGDGIVILRPVRVTDADFYVSIRMQYSMMYRAIVHVDKVDNKKLLMTDLFKPESFYCVIEDAETSKPVGYIGIKNTRDEIWEIAIELDEQFTHKGFGMRSIRLFLNEIHRITCKKEYKAAVEPDNLPSQKCFEKLGAELVGLCDGPILKLEVEKKRFEERNSNLIDDNIRKLAVRLGVEPQKLLSHVLDYRMKYPL